MALSATTLSTAIKAELTTAGFKVNNSNAQVSALVDAISKAVVSHITTKASVVVASGSSAGSYKVS